MPNSLMVSKEFCSCCGKNSDLHEHHIIPRFMESKNQDKILLCSAHHNILHNFLNKTIWKNRSLSQEDLEEQLISFTKWYCKMEWVKWNPENKREFYSGHCILCRDQVRRFDWWDYSSDMGLFGLCKNCNEWEWNEYLKVKKEGENANTDT